MAHTGRRPSVASPAAKVTACCSAMPTSYTRSGCRSAKRSSPVPSGMAAVIATTRESRSAIRPRASAKQAVQLGYCPRVNIIHTSSTEMGQIYIPQVNNLLMIACIGLVLAFHSSSNL